MNKSKLNQLKSFVKESKAFIHKDFDNKINEMYDNETDEYARTVLCKSSSMLEEAYANLNNTTIILENYVKSCE